MSREVAWVWKETGWYVEPSTAREVMSMVGSIGVYSAGQKFAWRGMSSADYEVWSSLHRTLGRFATEEKLRSAEQKTLRDAREWGLGVQATGHVDDLQLLSDLQHYGIATRLLDFTSNSMTALWFACQDPKDARAAKSGLLLALNTTKWNTYLTVGRPNEHTYDVGDDPTGARLRGALSRPEAFRVESSAPNDRQRAQEGFFVTGAVPTPDFLKLPTSNGVSGTLFNTTPFVGLDVPFPPGDPEKLHNQLTEERRPGSPRAVPFVAVIIRAQLKAKLLRYLEGTYNRSSRVLFPDYSGFLEFSQAQKRESL